MFRKNTLEKTIKKGHEYLEKREFIKAKDTYLKALAHDPDNISLLNNLAQLYSLLGDTSKAKGYNEILLEKCNEYLKYEKTEEMLIFKANALISLKKENESNKVITELLKINPNNMIGLFHKSHYLEKNGLHAEALKYLENILKENPHRIAALLSKGRNLVEMNRFDEAEQCYNLVFEIEPKNKAAINLKSELFKRKNSLTLTSHDMMLKAVESFEMENFKASEDYFKKALNMNSDFDEIWFAQGELFIRIGKIGDAIKSFKKAFEINPNSGGIEKKKEFFKMLNRMKMINTFLGYEK
jgi:tetratricopeptide (TPR) repeat protein